MGYRSVHLICDLGKRREALPEFTDYAGLVFEVQVRTVLQHAWAEIEHDRKYKFSGVLPEDMQRRLNLVAGQLEFADRELDSLATSIDAYGKDISARTKTGSLDIPIDSVSLAQFLKARKERIHSLDWKLPFDRASELALIDELKSFGITTLEQLDTFFSKEFIKAFEIHKPAGSPATDLGLLRSAMMFADVNRYFETAWKNRWRGWTQSSRNLVASKYGQEVVTRLSKKYKLVRSK